jgi:hypothetical protein
MMADPLLGLGRAVLLRRPNTEWPADLPLVAEGVDDPAHCPTVLLTHRSNLAGTDTHSPD